MILAEPTYARFDALSRAEQEDEHEKYRCARAGSPAAVRREVEGLLDSICQEVYAASWIAHFENQVWEMIHREGPPGAGVYDLGVAAAGDLARVAALSIEAGWWPIFDHPDPDPWTIGRAISIDAAQKLYRGRA